MGRMDSNSPEATVDVVEARVINRCFAAAGPSAGKTNRQTAKPTVTVAFAGVIHMPGTMPEPSGPGKHPQDSNAAVCYRPKL